MSITAERLKQLLSYEPSSGVFRWRADGSIARYNRRGYVEIYVDGRCYPAHRLAWLYVHGRWPRELIDHADMDRSNNGISNLREASRSQNGRNSRVRSHNKTRLKGVSYDSQRRNFRAQISVDGRTRSLGRFKCALLAHLAYLKEVKAIAGEFARSA